MALADGRRSPLDSKGWKGVRDLDDPYSVPPNYLLRARNMYLPEPGSGVGAYARPGFQLLNPDAPLAVLGSGRIGQGMCVATMDDGTQVNFVACGGKLYRVGTDLATYVDVTPAGITIEASTRVYLTPFSNRIAVNDGTNPPWIASNLLGAPVTGTVITYSNTDPFWLAFGPARVKDGRLVWLVRVRDGTRHTARIGWSEPDDPFTGYFQTNFDNEWDVIENNADSIFALWPTNLVLDYFRNASIGYLSGAIDADFRTTATSDAIGNKVGMRAPDAIAAYGDWIFFADTEGRVHRMQQGGGLEPRWLDMRRVVTAAPTGFVDITAQTACVAIVPELDLVLFALWSPDATQAVLQYATTLYAFDAKTGRYVGEWTIAGGIAVHTMGVLVGVDGRERLVVLGTAAAEAVQALGNGGFLWVLSTLADGIWTDNGLLPDLSATVPPLGYDVDLTLLVDQVTAVVEEVQVDPTPATMDIIVGV